MIKRKHVGRGFTIVELLIVIVVIGILATITIISYQGIQRKALNTARLAELKDWHKLFEIYKATTGSYPTGDGPGNTNYCLGTGFPIGHDGQARCREINNSDPLFSYVESNAAALNARIEAAAGAPKAAKHLVLGWLVGPWVEFEPDWNEIRISTAIHSDDERDCTNQGFVASWNDPNDANMICTIYIRPAW